MGVLLKLMDERRISTANYITFVNPAPHPDRIMSEHDFLYMIDGSWRIREEDEAFEMHSDDLWIHWAQELQFLAQCGLAYGKDVYDIERYERVREISAEMVAHMTEIPIARVRELFCNESGFQTPKLDTRAAIFQDGRILSGPEHPQALPLKDVHHAAVCEGRAVCGRLRAHDLALKDPRVAGLERAGCLSGDDDLGIRACLLHDVTLLWAL